MSQTQSSVPILLGPLGGAITVNVFAILSALALASVLLRAIWLAIRIAWLNASPTQAQEIVFFHTQLGNYASCLIIGLMFNSIAGIIGVQWLLHEGITEGWTCRIQALFMQLGNFSVGYFTIAIAVHTFNSLVLKMRQSVVICRTTIVTGWVFTGLVAAAPFAIHLSEGPVYGAGPLACGVRAVYPKLLFVFHILPILLASLLGAILYSLIFLVLRGSLKLKSGMKLTLDPSSRWHVSEGVTESYHRFIARLAQSMLWYPVAYIVLLIPYAITRLFMVSGFAVPYQAIVFSSVCWYSLSVVDVFLLYNTFRVLGPAFDARSVVSTRKSMASMGNLEKFSPSAPSGYGADMTQKIHQYRSESVSTLHSADRSISDSSLHSGRPLLPLHHGKENSIANNSMLGRVIMTNDNRQWEVATPAPAATLPGHTKQQLQQSLTHSLAESNSSGGLPAPPRQSRSVLLTLPEPPRSARRPNNHTETEQWLNHQRSTNTFGHQRSPSTRSVSLYSEDGVSSPQWTSQSMHQNLRRKMSSGQLAVSSVGPNIPTWISPVSPPVSAFVERNVSTQSATRFTPATNGPRPLLLSHAGRTSSVDTSSKSRSQLPPTTGYF